MNDLMRLPLDILSGMGFIGAGAIVRRDNFVVGVTTAAIMWLLTVLGLCFDGGQMMPWTRANRYRRGHSDVVEIRRGQDETGPAGASSCRDQFLRA